MTFASATQFHVFLPWGQCQFSKQVVCCRTDGALHSTNLDYRGNQPGHTTDVPCPGATVPRSGLWSRLRGGGRARGRVQQRPRGVPPGEDSAALRVQRPGPRLQPIAAMNRGSTLHPEHRARHKHLMCPVTRQLGRGLSLELQTKIIERFPNISQSRRRPLLGPSPG